MEIFRFICKRTLWSLVALVGLSIIIFTLSRVVPGDPARMALGPRATEEAVEALRSELKLDQPVMYQDVYKRQVFKDSSNNGCCHG